MARLALLLAVLASGCTSSARLVDTADPMGIADAQQTLAGRTVVVELASGTREGGRVVYVRADSTAWDAGGALRTVPTASIVAVEIPRRGPKPGAFTGAAIGAAAGLAVGAIDLGGDLSGGTGIIAVFAVPVGVFVGTVAGAVTGAVARPVRFVWATGD